MGEILKLLSQNPVALIILGILLGLLLLSITIIYIIAFFQGREISFYPPKIGSRLSNKEQKESEVKKENNQAVADKIISNPNNNSALHLTRADISISTPAFNDCSQLSISTEKITDFILGEAARHPALFISPFSSIPLVFENNVIFLSWDGSQANIERVLHRSDAYPTSDSWFLCVSLYRQATALPYRNKKGKAILSETETRHIVNLYRKLLRIVKGFIEQNKEGIEKLAVDISTFESLLDEAEVALFNENSDIGIVRLEALLSSIHKFLLLNAPQAKKEIKQKPNGTKSLTPKLSGKGEKSILIVDDQDVVLEGIAVIIEMNGYRIATAQNGEEALKAMVENDYDLVLTDMVMPVLDGREVALGAKMISPKTKILVLTSFPETSKKANTPHDGYLLKDATRNELLTCIRDLLA